MLTLLIAAPFFLAFEVWQLVLSERYLGIKQIARGVDPRALGLNELTAFFWSVSLLAYWGWMLALLFVPGVRGPGLALVLVSMIGFSLRRGIALKRVLVILTIEGALRIFLLVVLSRFAWRLL
jgi:hypothetical protein